MSTLGLQSIVFIVGGWGMFRTHLQAEVKGAVAFGYGLRVWRYVEQAIQCPWLYVCWTEKSGEVTLSSMLMVADMSMFEDMLTGRPRSCEWRMCYLLAQGTSIEVLVG